MGKIKPSDYINIQGWMRTKLGLNGNQLMLYALIHGFSKDGTTEFTGTIPYVAEWLGCSRQTAITTLQKLTECGLIFKREWIDQKGSNTAYWINFDKITEVTAGGQKIGPRESNFCNTGGQKIGPNNNINNTIPPIAPHGGSESDVQKKQRTMPKDAKGNVILSELQQDLFDEFWMRYPRKTAKETAKRKWWQLDPDPATLNMMIRAIDAQKETDQWQRNVIPHPATWLNQRRWEDVLEPAAKAEQRKDEAVWV